AVLYFDHPLHLVPTLPGGSKTGCDQTAEIKSTFAIDNLMPTARDGGVEQSHCEQRTANHNGSLNHIGPNDCFNPTERCIDRGKNDDHYRSADVNEERFGLSRPDTANHLVGERQCNGSYVQTC